MATNAQTSNGTGWLEAGGVPHILRTLRMAIHPSKLFIGLVAITLTLVLGRSLDLVFSPKEGLDATAITRFIDAKQLDKSYEEPAGKQTIFQVWKRHQQRCVLGVLGSVLPGASMTAGTPVGAYLDAYSQAQPLENLIGMVYGLWWLGSCHFGYFLCLGIGGLLIWSLAGGAICRTAAVEFAHGRKLTMKQALSFGRKKLIGGFFLAPCIPLAFMFLTVILLVVGGMFLRIPLLGDLLAGLAFGLAIFGGFIITLLMVGLLVGGSLFWPAVAVEGSDAFDAFSRGISYPLSKPFKALLYAVLTIIYAGVCWVFLNIFTFYTLKITHVAVRMGTSWFGWWPRGEEEAAVSKLEVLWPMAGMKAVYDWPDWQTLHWNEWISAGLIAVWVLMVIGLMWSFLASFYFSGCTVVYYLLRRDVDGTDLEDVHLEEDEEDAAPSAAPAGTAPASLSDTSPTDSKAAAPAASPEPGTEGAPAEESTGKAEEASSSDVDPPPTS